MCRGLASTSVRDRQHEPSDALPLRNPSLHIEWPTANRSRRRGSWERSCLTARRQSASYGPPEPALRRGFCYPPRGPFEHPGDGRNGRPRARAHETHAQARGAVDDVSDAVVAWIAASETALNRCATTTAPDAESIRGRIDDDIASGRQRLPLALPCRAELDDRTAFRVSPRRPPDRPGA